MQLLFFAEMMRKSYVASWPAALAPLTSCCATEEALTLPLT